MNTVKILSLHFGKVRQIESGQSGEWWDKSWQTGFYKEEQSRSAWLGYEGFRSDEQADRKHHGGPEKAVCVYPAEHYLHWRETLAIPDFPYGAFGENLTLQGLLETEACVGDQYTLGEAEVQITQPRQPCWKLARRWQVKDLAAQVEANGFTGFYFRVIRHGYVRPGDTLALLQRPFPSWTIERCNQIMHRDTHDYQSARSLSECPALSTSWKDSLHLRSEKKAALENQLRTGQP
jgi:MOSC domain-containing protein YiiM